jgi:hypothetical protein
MPLSLANFLQCQIWNFLADHGEICAFLTLISEEKVCKAVKNISHGKRTVSGDFLYI